jgi:hypothetical protein
MEDDRQWRALNARDLRANTRVTDLDLAPDLALLGAGTLGRGAYEILVNAPVPRSSYISPRFTYAGSPSLLLTVNGIDFVRNSSMQVNGRPVPTTFVNASELQAAIDASGPGGGTSNSLPLTITAPPLPAAFAASAGAPNFAGHLVGSGQGIGTDAAGNVYVAGYVGGTITPSDTDGYVAKYSASGVLQWQQLVQGLDPLGNSFADSADAIAVDPAGNSYVAGNFRATLHLGNFTLTSTGPLDVFVEKFDTTGKVLWVHQFANTGNFGPRLASWLSRTAKLREGYRWLAGEMTGKGSRKRSLMVSGWLACVCAARVGLQPAAALWMMVGVLVLVVCACVRAGAVQSILRMRICGISADSTFKGSTFIEY